MDLVPSRVLELLTKTIEEQETPLKALDAWLILISDLRRIDSEASAPRSASPEIPSTSSRDEQRTKELIVETVDKGQLSGEIRQDVDASTVAETLLTFATGLSVSDDPSLSHDDKLRAIRAYLKLISKRKP